MTISVGQIGTFSSLACGTSFQTVATGSPTTTGSGFIVAVAICGTQTISSVTDTFSNTYVQASRIFDATENYGFERWYCANGSGGGSHQATVNISANTCVYAALIEAKGGALTNVAFYGAANSTFHTFPNSSPYTTSLSVTPPAAGALLISCFIGGSTTGTASSPTLSESSGFTIIGQTNLQGGGNVPSIAYQVVTATNTYTPSWTFAAPVGVDGDVTIDSFFGGVILSLGVRQACVADSGNTGVLSQSGSFASATLAGSTIFVVAKASTVSGTAFSSFADAINGGYQALELITDAGAFGQFKGYVFQNAQSVGTAQSLTVTASVSQAHLGFVALEIQGTSPSSLAAHTAQLQTLATAAANAITSGTVQAGTGAAIAVAVSINATQHNATFAPTVGTGYTICPSPGGNFWLSGALNIATAEFQTLTNPGGVAATFTPPGATSDDYVTFLAVFNSIGGAFVPPFTATQFFVNDQYFQS